jgi:hypothetical protein
MHSRSFPQASDARPRTSAAGRVGSSSELAGSSSPACQPARLVTTAQSQQ